MMTFSNDVSKFHRCLQRHRWAGPLPESEGHCQIVESDLNQPHPTLSDLIRLYSTSSDFIRPHPTSSSHSSVANMQQEWGSWASRLPTPYPSSQNCSFHSNLCGLMIVIETEAERERNVLQPRRSKTRRSNFSLLRKREREREDWGSEHREKFARILFSKAWAGEAVIILFLLKKYESQDRNVVSNILFSLFILKISHNIPIRSGSI